MQIHEFLQRSAKDVMVTDLTTLRPDDTLANAAHQFLHEQISGAPVVDAGGRCVGVLSVTDIVGADERIAAQHAEVVEAFFSRSDLLLPVSIFEQGLAEVRDKTTPAADQLVANFMVTDVVAVKEQATLKEIVRDLVDAHVHRVLVVNEEGKLVGLISTIDVLAALLRVPN